MAVCCEANGVIRKYRWYSSASRATTVATDRANPKYVDVIVQRWQDQKGQSAKLEATGKSFGEMASRVAA